VTQTERISRVRLRLLLGFVVLPLVAAIGVSVGRLGADARRHAANEDLRFADGLVATLATSSRPAPNRIPVLDPLLLRLSRLPPNYDVGVYSGNRLELRFNAGALPDVFPEPLLNTLRSRDASLITTLNERPVAIAPIKDAGQWEVVGSVLVARRSVYPVRFPRSALLVGLGIVLLTIAACVRAVLRHRHRFVHHLSFFVPGFAFLAYMLATQDTAAPNELETFRFWTVLSITVWAVLAAIGISLDSRSHQRLRLQEALTAWAFLAPSFLHLLLFSVGPIAFSLYLSVHEWNLVEPQRPFVGLANYRELAGDGGFWVAVRNTALYVLFVPIAVVLALALALLTNRRFRGAHLLRAAFFLPYITSFVAISLVWKWMFEPEVGLLNTLLARVGVAPLPFLGSPATALPSLMLMSVWLYAGYMMVIFLAGLQNIPESLYESARIDGARRWQRFRHITLPQLKPTTLFVLVTMVIFMFQVFTAVYVMTEGGPLHATDVIVYHIYRNAWEYLRLGYASAMAWILFAAVFLITLVQFRALHGRSLA
jgi:multiple sugar transport system permease protein